jgi:hypothetical protein
VSFKASKIWRKRKRNTLLCSQVKSKSSLWNISLFENFRNRTSEKARRKVPENYRTLLERHGNQGSKAKFAAKVEKEESTRSNILKRNKRRMSRYTIAKLLYLHY